PLAGYVTGSLPAANQIVGLSPLATNSLIGKQKYESTYNGSFQIQQAVGFSTVVQAAYVFNLDRHSLLNQTINNVTTLGIPTNAGALFNQYQPAALDPTRAYLDQYLPGNACTSFTNGVCTSGRALSDDYFRAQFPGYGGITTQCFCGSADIHSLQATGRRNFTKKLSFSGSYTWLK